jgi:hypothetical protein
MVTIGELLADNKAAQNVQAAAALARKRSEAAKKGAATKREKLRVSKLKIQVKSLFSPAPVYRPHGS